MGEKGMNVRINVLYLSQPSYLCRGEKMNCAKELCNIMYQSKAINLLVLHTSNHCCGQFSPNKK